MVFELTILLCLKWQGLKEVVILAPNVLIIIVMRLELHVVGKVLAHKLNDELRLILPLFDGYHFHPNYISKLVILT